MNIIYCISLIITMFINFDNRNINDIGYTDKNKLVYFGADNCTACKTLENTTFQDPSIISYINNNYYPVYTKTNTSSIILQQYKYNINMLPTIIILDDNNHSIKKLEGRINITSYFKDSLK